MDMTKDYLLIKEANEEWMESQRKNFYDGRHFVAEELKGAVRSIEDIENLSVDADGNDAIDKSIENLLRICGFLKEMHASKRNWVDGQVVENILSQIDEETTYYWRAQKLAELKKHPSFENMVVSHLSKQLSGDNVKASMESLSLDGKSGMKLYRTSIKDGKLKDMADDVALVDMILDAR